MGNRYAYQYLKTSKIVFILIFTIIFSYIDAPYMDIRHSFSDFIMYELNSGLIFQFAIFIIWIIFWIDKFGENTFLEEIRYHKYFYYFKNILKGISFLSIITALLVFLGIVIGGTIYKIFGMPSILYDTTEKSIEVLSYAVAIKDIFGFLTIPISIVYSALGYLFLALIFFYIEKRFNELGSKLLTILIVMLNIQIVVAGDMSFYFEPFKYIWFLYPNYYISLPFVFSEKGIYHGLFLVLIEILFIAFVALKVKKQGIKWIRR